MNADQKALMEYWQAWIYERDEDEREMAAYILWCVGERKLKIVEPACGGGKLCVPLAEGGHQVTGIDCSREMLNQAVKKAESLPNLQLQEADMLLQPWGKGFDIAILGGNLMVNIVTDRDYKRAQKNLLERAWEALKMGGKLFLDFDCPDVLSKWAPANREWVCFEGEDDRGTYGRYIVKDGTVDDRQRIITGERRWEMKTAQGENFVHTEKSYKHFPGLEQVCAMLYRVGFAVESIHGGYRGEAFDRDHRRAVIWARKCRI